jgi:hypothetical protein
MLESIHARYGSICVTDVNHDDKPNIDVDLFLPINTLSRNTFSDRLYICSWIGSLQIDNFVQRGFLFKHAGATSAS